MSNSQDRPGLASDDGRSIHDLLAAKGQIGHIWGLDDVQRRHPDLDQEQAWKVLQSVRDGLDSTFGITWEVIDYHAALLFGAGKPHRKRDMSDIEDLMASMDEDEDEVPPKPGSTSSRT